MNPRIGEMNRTISESGLEMYQHAQDVAITVKVIEISEDAYKQNNIYRPWLDSEIGQKRKGKELCCHAVTAIIAEELAAA